MKKCISIIMSIFYFLSAIESLVNFNDINNFPTDNISFGIFYVKLVVENGEVPENISNAVLLILLILVFGALITLTLATTYKNNKLKKYAIIILFFMLLANLFTWIFHGLSETMYIWVLLVAVNILIIILTVFISKKERKMM
ncbi:MAG: hypothetical protein IKC45_09010 [Clostridia bacterium]|nr:hypothetical protein [Clostridia bacterium]